MCLAHFLKIKFFCLSFLSLSLLIPARSLAGDGQSGIPPGRSAELESLLNPKALAPDHPISSSGQLAGGFLNPPADYRSMPLWVWNDELTWPRLQQQLHQFKEQGMGGVFIHPRPGLMTEYMGKEWFQLWKQSAEEGKKIGLRVNIYDENSYPSGFSGGLVPAMAPDTACQYVMAEIEREANSVWLAEANLVAAFVIKEDTSGQIQVVRRLGHNSEFVPGETLLKFRLRRASGNPWTGGFPYVDLTNPQTGRLFLQTTFEPYKTQVGSEFGNTVKWIFDDEPLIGTAGAYDSAPLALPLSRNTLAEFQKRFHYDLADYLPSLYRDIGEFKKIRFDYFQLLHDLFIENYLKPIFLWCDRNHLQFTGHWMEHEWPYPWLGPADASFYAYEHMPGIDMLEGNLIRTQGSDPHMLFTIKQMSSAAHQLGRRAFCEAYGVAGWDSTFEHYKRFGDWLMVHGVDFMNQHLAYSTIRGARKRDHPQSFSDISPWWPYYKLHGDHLGRVSYMLSQGVSHNRLLVLEPTTSGYLWARREGATPENEQIRKSYDTLVQYLADRQVDFDLADEYLLDWFGKQENKKLVIGKSAYDLIIWPEEMINLRRQSLPRLEQYLAAGGEVLALSAPAAFVDGRPSEAVTHLVSRYASQWHQVASLASLEKEISLRLKPRLHSNVSLANVGFAERCLENGDRILFFANTGLKAVNALIDVDGGAVERWDTLNGNSETLPFNLPGNGPLSFTLNLAPAGSELMIIKKNPAPSARMIPAATRHVAANLSDWQNSTDSANVLVLDYCDLKLQDITKTDLNTWAANWTIWQSHGFERPAWDNAVQYKTRIYDRNTFSAESGFEATYRFTATDPAVLATLQLAMETPELYQVTINGTAISFDAGTVWLDPHIRSVPIGRWAKPGDNLVTVSGHPFDVRMELENIYLRGQFAAVQAEKGFRLEPAKPLQFGSWRQQGYPFLTGSSLYTTEVTAPADTTQMKVELGEWAGSVVEILLDGKQAAILGWPPYEAEFPAQPGKHQLGIRVVSTPRNLFGPFHNPAKPRMRAWPSMWAEFPARQPAGAEYDLLDYGLFKVPKVSFGMKAPGK